MAKCNGIYAKMASAQQFGDVMTDADDERLSISPPTADEHCSNASKVKSIIGEPKRKTSESVRGFYFTFAY